MYLLAPDVHLAVLTLYFYLLGMEQDEMAQVFEEWNKGELDSFLIEITRDILKFKDADGKCLPSFL